jgi:serine/threonine protein kinase
MMTHSSEREFSGKIKPAQLGDSIQDYAIVKLLGKGGFGHVYEAQSKLCGQKVAIKMVR